MAEAFIGMTVTVKLKPPSSVEVVIGRVVNIHNHTLILEQVYLPKTAQSLVSFTIPSHQIADLEVTESHQPPVFSAPSTLPLRNAPTYNDPAILSFKKPSIGLTVSVDNRSVPRQPVFTPAKELPAEAVDSPDATPSKPPPLPSLQLPVEIATSQTERGPQSARGTTFTKAPQSTNKKAKGWRSTPLLEEASGPGQTVDTPPAKPSTLMVKPSTRAKKSGRRSRQEQQAQQNGWATEDATDVQDMGDFDFEANLSKFDKKAVFETIRNDDMTADEDRLVSHNRIARPGTYGGKNLHPTEMVLSPPIKPVGDSELDVLSYSASDVDLANDRDSRQSLQARNHVMGAPERAISGIGERSLSRTLRNVSSNQRPLNASVLSAASLNRSTSSIRNSQTHSDRGGPHLKVLSTGTPCPIVSRERLQHLVKEYGDIPGLCNGGLIEVTALAIAQAVCKATYHLHDPSRRNSRASVAAGQGSRTRDPKPVIVILAGNHDRGSYVLAAARYLLGKDFRLLVSYADSDKADASDALCSRQLALLRRLPRRRNLWIDSWPLINAQIKKLKSPPALILDALLDGSSYGAIENIQSAIETREVIDWCNRSRAQVISIACPSGYDDRTGETTVLEGEPVAVKPDRVLALGAALQGVFLAMSEGERWGLTVLDVGLSMVLHGKEVIRYGMDWSMDVEFDGGD